MQIRLLFFLISLSSLLLTSTSSFPTKGRGNKLHNESLKSLSPFSAALEALEKQIGYNFSRFGLLRLAMTHPSYSEENNRALSILGLSVIETSISLGSLKRNIEISPKDLNRRIREITEVDSCAVDGLLLGLQKVVRVAPKINSSVPAVVCGAFRSIFGAVAVDTSKADVAGNLFWNVHNAGGALVL